MREKELKKAVADFGETLRRGLAYIEASAKTYAEAVGRWPDAKIAFRRQYPYLTKKDWDILLDIGNGKLAPRAYLIPNFSAIQALRVFPLEQQTSLVGTDNAAPTPQRVYSRGRVVSKTFDAMSSVEIETLVDRKAARLRTVEEQIAAAAKAARAGAQTRQMKWEIRDGVLYIFEPTVLSLDEVLRIERKMKEFAK